MLTEVAAALAVHAGKAFIDRLIENYWRPDAPDRTEKTRAVGVGGDLSNYSAPGRAIVPPELTIGMEEPFATISGDLFYPAGALRLLEDKIALKVMVDEETGEPWYVEADPEFGYEISVPPGIYSMAIIVLDARTGDVRGVGQPVNIDLSELDSFEFATDADREAIIIDTPVEVEPGDYDLDYLIEEVVEAVPPEAADAACGVGRGHLFGPRDICVICGCSRAAVGKFGWDCAPVAKVASQAHDFDGDDVCARCGCSRMAVEKFGWDCTPSG